MANYSREDAQKQAEAGTGAAVGGILGLAALIIGSAVKNSADKAEKKNLRERQIALEEEIRIINYKISEYENQFMGSWLNSEQISALKSERARCQEKLAEIKKQLI